MMTLKKRVPDPEIVWHILRGGGGPKSVRLVSVVSHDASVTTLCPSIAHVPVVKAVLKCENSSPITP